MKKETMFYILSFFAVLLALTGAISYTGNDENLENFYQVKIENGDSLWSIAEKFDGTTNISKQEFVKWVQDKNGIHSSVIKPGDRIIVPVEKEHFYLLEHVASEK